jgi:hypothetical protein
MIHCGFIIEKAGSSNWWFLLSKRVAAFISNAEIQLQALVAGRSITVVDNGSVISTFAVHVYPEQ